MNNHPDILRIKEYAQNLLTCNDDFLVLKQSVDGLFAIFSEITGITVDNFNMEQILLPSGKAISPSGAAHCLLEFKRTAIFLRGINKAIKQKLRDKNNRPVHILYAGTGPYATLILPILTLYSPDELQVDLLDINEISLKAARILISRLGMEHFINETFLCDATTFVAKIKYDVVISETMQAALKKEPQVAIMQNLVPQMAAGGIFIPERISVSMALVSNGRWDDEKMIYTDIDVLIKEDLFNVDREHLDIAGYQEEITLPGPVGKSNKLYLNTTITVFDSEILKDGDNSLTLPFRVCELDREQEGILRFWYEQGEIPGVRCQIVGSDKVYAATGKKNRIDLCYNPSIMRE